MLVCLRFHVGYLLYSANMLKTYFSSSHAMLMCSLLDQRYHLHLFQLITKKLSGFRLN